MQYLERNLEKRLDPGLILPEVKTVAVFPWPYSGGGDLPYSDAGKGIVSKYARGRDYHKLITKRLRRLVREIGREFPGLNAKAYVDTGPVLEKYWAERSGLGWIGKHTNLIDRRCGSWFFLGVLFLDREVPPDSEARNYCGSCRRCIDVCPTSAIVEPYVMDSRKCISYLTIELREDIPVRLRKPMGNLIFGCDLCQDVCPWNTRYCSEKETGIPVDDLVFDLKKLAFLSEDRFDEFFQGRAIRRTRWRGLMRNAAIAMGNSGRSDFLPALEHLLNCPDPMVRRHAAWGLREIGSDRAISALRSRLAVEDDPATDHEIRRLLDNPDSGVCD